MAPVIRVSDETYRLLQERATPFVDTPEDVIRRLLGADSAPRPRSHEGVVDDGRSASRLGRKRSRTMHLLLQAGKLQPGTRVTIFNPSLTGALPSDSSDRRWHARIGPRARARENIVWEYDGRLYSLSRLTDILRDEHALPISAGGVNGYLHWALEEEPEKSLWDLAESLGRVSLGSALPAETEARSKRDLRVQKTAERELAVDLIERARKGEIDL